VIVSALVVTTVVLQSSTADTLRLLAQRQPPLPESALVLEVRARPLAVRDAVTDALRHAVKESTPAAREEQLAVARRIAAANAVGWRDSFLVREVERFAAWDPSARAGKIWVDSVRRAGNVVYGRDGAGAAIVIWRGALRRARAIGDSAGVAALMGNIGAAFLEESRLDSAGVYLERARAIAAAIGDVRVEANALGMLAGVSADRGDVAAARLQYGQALALRERIADSRGVAADHNNLGLLAQQLGDLDEARGHFEAALALNRRDGRDDAAATNLVNLAGLASLGGDLGRATRLYQDALATWRAREEWAEAAAALHGLGQVGVRRGDYPAAARAFREALAIYNRTGPRGAGLDVRRELAGALAAEGDLQGAIETLRAAQRLADSVRAPADGRAGLALARADLAVQMNALTEAERLYARAEFLYRQADNRAGAADAQEGRGLLLGARGDFTRAQAVLDAARRTQQEIGNQRAAALTRLSLARLALQRGDTATARAHLTRALSDIERLGDSVATAAVLNERAALEADAGGAAVAESLYTIGLRTLGSRLAPDVSWRLHAGLGVVLRARGDLDGSARELRAATHDVERAGQSFTLAERRSAFLSDKWDVYAQLTLTERTRNRPNGAFEAAEQMRARQMLELLARGRVSAADTVRELVDREQDLRRRITELTSRQSEEDSRALRGSGQGGADVVAMNRDALSQAQDEYAELLLELRERRPSHVALIAPPTATAGDIAQRLATDEAFIEYLVSDSGSLAFLITKDTFVVQDLNGRRRELARLVEFARGTLGRPGSPVTDSLWRGPLGTLYQMLIAPLEETGLLVGKTRLVVAPHAELHYLPFAALLDTARRFLIQRYEVTTTPSASVWLALGGRSESSRGEGGGGMLALAPRPDALPASRREVATIAQLTGARVLSGSSATEAAFRREAPGRRVIHLATYGVLNKRNPLFSYVQLAPDEEDDGRLEVHEVFGLDLAADLVVLSACETGVGSGSLTDVPAGDDWVGLTRGFLQAGAAQVVATLWLVDDWATAGLMEQFYTSYATDADPARALARAQRAMLSESATAHPFYWAGFEAVGGAR
jgi:CHAT domain-containing protein/Tfp pilus assembly protein PilF